MPPLQINACLTQASLIFLERAWGTWTLNQSDTAPPPQATYPLPAAAAVTKHLLHWHWLHCCHSQLYQQMHRHVPPARIAEMARDSHCRCVSRPIWHRHPHIHTTEGPDTSHGPRHSSNSCLWPLLQCWQEVAQLWRCWWSWLWWKQSQ